MASSILFCNLRNITGKKKKKKGKKHAELIEDPMGAGSQDSDGDWFLGQTQTQLRHVAFLLH